MTAPQVDLDLAEHMAQFYGDPLGFVLTAFPWNTPHTPLAEESGPDPVQRQFLRDLGKEVAKRRFNGQDPVAPILMAASSGHGTGKSVLGAMLTCWLLSTRPYSIGTVTANTYTQLESRTWATIQKWARMCLTAHWFHIRAGGIYSRVSPEDWKVVAQTCKEENAQSFAGQHARTSTSWYMVDEASHVPDGIWDVAQGGLTDGEPMFFAWGQPARKSGRFYEICFGKMRDRWDVRCIDSRRSAFTNKALIEEWIRDYGEDSDFVRVRVRGLAPRAGDLQFIDQDRIDGSKRRPAVTFPDDPLVAGFDVSGGGQAWNVVWFRRGLDARTIPPIRIPGEHSQERSAILAKLSEILSDRRPGREVSMMFVDSAYGAPYVERLRQQFDNIQEVNFGGPSPDRHQANMRAYMWQHMKDWLERGAIPENDPLLEVDLTAPGSHLNRSDQLVLESKENMAKRGVASPDNGDALCFLAGTQVRTSQGSVPIENIRVGDLVVTPFGSSPVMVIHKSDAIALTTVQFSIGAALVGKPSHELFTYSRGTLTMDALTLTDDVECFSQWRLFLWRLVSLCSIGVRSFGFKQQAATFIPGSRITRKDFCIAGFGATYTALFRKATTFTTGMVTGGIMNLPIWNWPWLASTNANICGSGLPIPQHSSKTETGWNWPAPQRLSGTDLKKDAHGTKHMAQRLGKAESRSLQSVPDAASDTRPSFLLVTDSVATPVSKQWLFGVISRMRASAPGAAKTLWRTVIGRRPVVPVLVATASVPPTRTYNLTLKEHNAYYANDILVFNCLTFAAHVAPVRPDRNLGRFTTGGSGSWMS